MNEIKIDFLEKFIYLSKFERLFSPPFFKKIKFELPKNLESSFNSNKILNNIVEFILDKRNHLNLDES